MFSRQFGCPHLPLTVKDMKTLHAVRRLVLVLFVTTLSVDRSTSGAEPLERAFEFSQEHIAAASRKRRIIINFDTISGDRRFGGRDPKELVEWKFHVIDAADVQIDSVWWDWGEGNQAPWPSKTMPLYDAEGYRKWVREGVDIPAVFAAACKKRGIEAFYNFRVNGADNDLGPFRQMKRKLAHPEWLIKVWPGPVGLWNYAIPDVREHRLTILREIAERYDYDGVALDFARGCPLFLSGTGWLNRHKMTDFMRQFRSITQEAARKRGRPLLIGARVQENLEGAHFDGLDLETWVREGLVDVLSLGIRNFDVDIGAYRRLTAGTHIQIYPCVDDHHASDGYATPPIEIYRGVAANWWQQGADGIQTFNFNHAPDFPYRRVWKTHLQAYREIGNPETLRHKNKVFTVGRRGGGHGPTVIPNAEDWTTPRHMYSNTNMLAPLPANLPGDGKADRMLTIALADDVGRDRDHVDRISLRVLLSDPNADSLPAEKRLDGTVVATIGHPEGGLKNIPPAKGVEDSLEARVNNIPLKPPTVDGSWIVFSDLSPELFAVGNNLVGLRYTGPTRRADKEIFIEKLEVHVSYPRG